MKHLTPTEAWAYLKAHPEALFLDIRMEIEYLYVGHPPGVVHVPWYEYPELAANPAGFVKAVEAEARGKDQPLVLICRSGNRTVEAGQALEAAGFTEVVNVLEGFEGDLDEHFHRSTLGGWRHAGLPWEQL